MNIKNIRIYLTDSHFTQLQGRQQSLDLENRRKKIYRE